MCSGCEAYMAMAGSSSQVNSEAKKLIDHKTALLPAQNRPAFVQDSMCLFSSDDLLYAYLTLKRTRFMKISLACLARQTRSCELLILSLGHLSGGGGDLHTQSMT